MSDNSDERPMKRGFGIADMDASFLSSVADDAAAMLNNLGDPSNIVKGLRRNFGMDNEDERR